jgi:NAD+ kinase
MATPILAAAADTAPLWPLVRGTRGRSGGAIVSEACYHSDVGNLVKRVGFILKPDQTEAAPLLDELVPWALARNLIPVVTAEDHVGPEGVRIVPEDAFAAECDLAVVLGGDGTMLRASDLVAAHDVPVLGINLGRLGFLTPFRRGEAKDAIAAAIAGELDIGERSRLQVTHKPIEGEAITRCALNDAVVHQGAMARLIELEARLDGHLISSYRADGLIIATPTGSTAYNLAAGGPIIVPGQESMTITPICAHALTNRPLVVPKDSLITVQLGGESRGVILTVDGQWARSLQVGDVVEIGNAPKPLRIFESDKHYFDILREKLHWGRSPIGS